MHPFQDGNGRIGRLIMFKECLSYGIVPFIITDEIKMFNYRGLQQWEHIPEYLIDTCLSAQDSYKLCSTILESNINQLSNTSRADEPVLMISIVGLFNYR